MPTPWETLVAHALIGTDRQTPQIPAGEGQLKALLSQVPTEPESLLLHAAGIVASYQQAGQGAFSQDGPLPTRCPKEPYSPAVTVPISIYKPFSMVNTKTSYVNSWI